MAKRKPTSRPRPQRPAKRPGSPERSPGGPAARRRGTRGAAARALATVRRSGFLIVLVVAVGAAIALGVHQGRAQKEQGFGEATTQAPATRAPFRSEQEAAAGKPAREVFAHTCGSCHTLRAAGVGGGIGPNLDRRVLTTAKVREMIRTGSLDTLMPRNLLVGRDADRVARYVASVSIASQRARARAKR